MEDNTYELKAGSPKNAGLNSNILQRATDLLQSEIEARRITAASLLVARQGTVALSQGFGHLTPDKESSPVEPDSIFLLASITKPVTACALMLLVDQGQVSLNDPVSLYIPEFQGGNRSQILVRHPELDPYTRPETTYPLVEAILGPDARFAQFDFRDVPDGIGEKAAMHFHRDRGAVPPDFWAAHEKDCTFLCAIYYLNDVGPEDTCFCVVPNSQGHADIDEARAQMGDAYAEVPIRGPAGTCVFYNIGIYHTRRPGRNDAGRRTLHQYFSRETNPPLTNWALVPRRLAEHADPATRAYYSHWTDLMHDYAASFAPEFYAEHIGQKKT